jgi:hypothetical protein
MITLTAEMNVNYADDNIKRIDSSSLKSLSFSITDRGDVEQPNFGIFSNSGSMEIMDKYGHWLGLVEAGALKEGIKCTIYLNNTLENIQKTIAVAETTDWDYDNDNRVVSVTLKDDLEEWQQINIPASEYDPRKPEAKPYSWLYEELWRITTSKGYNMQSLSDLDEATKRILQRLYFEYPILYAGTLWDAWTKLCNVACLHIYKNGEGIIVCKYNGGN